jgi:hypothetical protein
VVYFVMTTVDPSLFNLLPPPLFSFFCSFPRLAIHCSQEQKQDEDEDDEQGKRTQAGRQGPCSGTAKAAAADEEGGGS